MHAVLKISYFDQSILADGCRNERIRDWVTKDFASARPRVAAFISVSG